MKTLMYKPNMTLHLRVRESAATKEKLQVSCPKDMGKHLGWLATSPEEKFVAIHLNAKQEIIGIHQVSHGTLSASLVHPREVFKAALLANSYSIIVAHNHPSGAILEPSREDLGTTRQLLKAGKILGVALVDHLILNPFQAIYSIRENHHRIWDDPFGGLS